MTLPRTESGEGDPGQVTRIAEEFIRLREAGNVTGHSRFQHRLRLRAEIARLGRFSLLADLCTNASTTGGYRWRPRTRGSLILRLSGRIPLPAPGDARTLQAARRLKPYQ